MLKPRMGEDGHPRHRRMSRGSILGLAVGFELILLALAFGLDAWLGLSVRRQFAIAGLPALAGAAGGLALAGLVLSLGESGFPFFSTIGRDMRSLSAVMFGECRTIDLVILSLMAGIGEEALFRGVIQPAVARGLGVIPAILLTSVLFGLAHAISLRYAVYATFLGICLGVLQVATAGIWPAVLAHAAYDLTALLFLVRGNPAPPGGTWA